MTLASLLNSFRLAGRHPRIELTLDCTKKTVTRGLYLSTNFCHHKKNGKCNLHSH